MEEPVKNAREDEEVRKPHYWIPVNIAGDFTRPGTNGHAFNVDDLKEAGVPEELLTEEFLTRLDEEWEEYLDEILEEEGPEAVEEVRNSAPEKNWFLIALLL